MNLVHFLSIQFNDIKNKYEYCKRINAQIHSIKYPFIVHTVKYKIICTFENLSNFGRSNLILT